MEQNYNLKQQNDQPDPASTQVKHYPTGETESEVQLVRGIPHGSVFGYYRNGKLRLHERFENGNPHGLQDGWYEDGSKMYQLTYHQGKRHGMCKSWYATGRKRYEITFEHDEMQNKQLWNAQGVPVSNLTDSEFWQE